MSISRKRSFYMSFIVGVLFMFLAGCGGGGGGGGGDGGDTSSSAYIGATTQAAITEENAQTIAEDTFANVMDTQNLPVDNLIMGMVSSDSTGVSSGARSIQLTKTITDLIKKNITSGAAETVAGVIYKRSYSDEGDCGGQATADMSINDKSGEFDMTMVCDTYCENGVTMDGEMKATGQASINDDDEIITIQMNVTLTAFSVTDSNGSVTIEGSFGMYGAPSYFSLTMDLIAKNNITQKTYWVNNFTLEGTDSFDYSTIDMSGRFYDYDYGYIDINTPTVFKINEGDDNPCEGVLVLQGKDNTKARLTCLDAYSYMIEADVNGDGAYEFSTGALYWP